MMFRLLPAAAAAGLAVLAAFSGAAADPAGEAVIRDLVSEIDALDGWSADAETIRSEDDDTIVEGLRFASDDGHVFDTAFGRFRGLAETTDGGISAAQVEWRDASFVSELFELELPALAARDVSLPDPATLAIDPDAPVSTSASFYSLLAEASIAAAQAPTMRIVQTSPGPGEATPVVTTANYSDVKVTNLDDGVIASMAVGGVETTSVGESISHLDFGAAEIETLSFAALAHVLDEKNYRGGFGDGIWRPVVGQAIYSDISGTASDGALYEIGEVAVQNLEGRQPAQPFTERLDSLPASGGEEGQDKAAQRLALSTLSDLLSAFRLGSVAVRDVSVRPSESADAEGTIASLSLTALSSEGFENFSIHDVSVEAPEGFARLDSLDVADFRFATFEAFSRLFELSEPDADPAARNEAIRAMLDALPRFTRASMTGAAAGMDGQDPVTLDRVDMSAEKYVGPFPTITRLALEGLTVPGALLRMEPQAARMLDRFDYDDLTFGMTLQEVWVPAETRSLTNLSFEIEDAVKVDLAYTYTGIDEDWVVASIARAADVEEKSDTAAMMAGLEGLNLESATLKVTDRSLTDRVLGYVAERQGLTVDGATYRQQLRGALPFLLSTIVPGNVANLLMTPLQDYLGGGKALVIEANPEEPVPLTAVLEAAEDDPLALVDLLGAEASTEEAQ